MRLVFPPFLGYQIFCALVMMPVRAYCPEVYQNPILGGFVIGYTLYDMIHYFIHHSTPKDGYMKSMKVYHMQHHYKNGQQGFGVSSKFWDYVF
jgi:4-hydroxysphinganine ceramide fatty acyl 2-hydroxylase